MIDDDELREMIDLSYELVVSNLPEPCGAESGRLITDRSRVDAERVGADRCVRRRGRPRRCVRSFGANGRMLKTSSGSFGSRGSRGCSAEVGGRRAEGTTTGGVLESAGYHALDHVRRTPVLPVPAATPYSDSAFTSPTRIPRCAPARSRSIMAACTPRGSLLLHRYPRCHHRLGSTTLSPARRRVPSRGRRHVPTPESATVSHVLPVARRPLPSEPARSKGRLCPPSRHAVDPRVPVATFLQGSQISAGRPWPASGGRAG